MIPSLQGCKVTGFIVFHVIAKGYIFINRVSRQGNPLHLTFHVSNDREIHNGNEEHRTEEISKKAEWLTGFSSFVYLVFYPTKGD